MPHFMAFPLTSFGQAFQFSSAKLFLVTVPLIFPLSHEGVFLWHFLFWIMIRILPGPIIHFFQATLRILVGILLFWLLFFSFKPVLSFLLFFIFSHKIGFNNSCHKILPDIKDLYVVSWQIKLSQRMHQLYQKQSRKRRRGQLLRWVIF